MNLQPFDIVARSGGTMKEFAINALNGESHKSFSVNSKLSFKAIQSIVRTGKAKDVFEIGHEFLTHYTYDGTVYDMPWVVLDNDRMCEWPDGTRHPGLWIGSKYATIEDIQFDAPEQEDATEETAQEGLYYCGRNGSTFLMLTYSLSAGDTIPYGDYEHVYHSIVDDRDVFRDGYNRYLHSAFRQWLNSAAGVDEWWTPQHVGDCPPIQLSQIKGFMAGLDSDFLSVINPVKIQVAVHNVMDGTTTDVMYDKFFMQSVEELYGSPQKKDVEGPFFPYWKQITGLESPTNGSSSDTNDARKIRKLNNQSGDAVAVRLRSKYLSRPYGSWRVNSGGYIGSYQFADDSFATLPACVIS